MHNAKTTRGGRLGSTDNLINPLIHLTPLFVLCIDITRIDAACQPAFELTMRIHYNARLYRTSVKHTRSGLPVVRAKPTLLRRCESQNSLYASTTTEAGCLLDDSNASVVLAMTSIHFAGMYQAGQSRAQQRHPIEHTKTTQARARLAKPRNHLANLT